jgi:hypothetical protein
MKIEIENPINTRNRKIGVGIAVLLLVAIVASIGIQGADSTDKVSEAKNLIVEAAESDIGNANISTYDSATVENKIQSARSKLDEAEEIEGETERIRYLRDGSELVLSLSSMMENLQSVQSGLSSAESYASSDRYDDALSEIEASSGEIESAQENLNQMNQQFQTLNEYDYNIEELTESNFRDRTARMENLLNYMENYVNSYDTMVRGLENLNSANTYLDEDEYNRAGNYYLDAKQNFQEAQEGFKSIEDSAPSNYKSTVISFTCRNGKLVTISEKSYQLTQAIEDGDQEEAQQLNEEVQGISLDSCN